MSMLYHYCSSKSFENIVTKKNLRLSSLLLSNDYNEGKVVSRMIDVLLYSEKIPSRDKQEISKLLNFFRDYFHGIGFCLSEKGDLLSQWRGYADNGYGVSIGFSKAALEELCKQAKTVGGREIRLKQINYDPLKHLPVVAPVIDSIKEISSDPKHNSTPLSGLLALAASMGIDEERSEMDEKRRTAMMLRLMPLWDELYTLKERAFLEESEWRLLSHIEGDDFNGIDFYSKQEKLIPFDVIKCDERLNSIITEVVIGPKHETPASVVENLLKSKGFSNIKVSKSIASYR